MVQAVAGYFSFFPLETFVKDKLNKYNSWTGLNHLIQTFDWSIKGFASTVKHEAAFRHELILFSVLAPFTFEPDNNEMGRTLLLDSMLFVLMVELLNTAVESVVYRIS